MCNNRSHLKPVIKGSSDLQQCYTVGGFLQVIKIIQDLVRKGDALTGLMPHHLFKGLYLRVQGKWQRKK